MRHSTAYSGARTIFNNTITLLAICIVVQTAIPSVALADDNVVAVVANLTDPPLFFADGFESGDTSAWSAAVP